MHNRKKANVINKIRVNKIIQQRIRVHVGTPQLYDDDIRQIKHQRFSEIIFTIDIQ